MPSTPLSEYYPYLLRGLLVTLEVTGWAILISVPTAFLMGIGRNSKVWIVRVSASVIIEFFRGTSAIVQLFWAFYVLPLLGVTLAPMVVAVVVLGLNEGSYDAETVRAAVTNVPKGQTEAAQALGFSTFDKYRRVILPQALLPMVPPFANGFINLMKGSSLVALITVPELTFRALKVRDITGDTVKILGLLLVAYFIISMIISGAMKLLENRLAAQIGLTQAKTPPRILSRMSTIKRGRSNQ